MIEVEKAGYNPNRENIGRFSSGGTRAVVTGIIRGQFYSAAYRGKLV